MYGFTHIVCVSFAGGFTVLLLFIFYSSVSTSLYFTFYLLKPGRNQKVEMNQLMKFIYRGTVSECS